MSDCPLFLLPSETCAHCTGSSLAVEEPDYEKKDYILTFQESVELEGPFAQWHKAVEPVRYEEVPQMGIRAAGTSVRLTNFVGRLIGLRYLGKDQVVDTTFGTATAARAELFDVEAGKHMGRTLIFQQAIAEEVRSQGSDWTVGVLRVEDNPKYADGTMYILDSEGIDLDAAIAAFEKAGIEA